MVQTYVYLSLFPESLVVSMLEPKQFGTYLSVGTEKRSSEHALYFDITGQVKSDYFKLEKAIEDCKPHPNGQPKHTIYVSTYRVLEHIDLDNLGSLWLSTRDGRVLELKKGHMKEPTGGKHHLYQELSPVHPLIASLLEPGDFCRFITDPDKTVSVPKICFVDMELAGLADDPESEDVQTLPYKNIDHIRDCLRELHSGNKNIKTVNRIQPQHVWYRVIKSGFYVGDREEILHYSFPSVEELERDHHNWWRSANLP